ncbi:3-dehydroquinate dehydratase II [Riemerella anatipestifer RA-CH-1]|uniref:3-dehydroquinate dehydratase n=2 Tax=Riemerella anatipestifer TaxID=34085 RepID=J9R0R3_RIEAN|nr:3-dehydroquinate dehydratase II [Riemerella anatipestifer RA-CH-1]
MMMKILIINGANLNLLGTREPEIYGNTSMAEVLANLKEKFVKHRIDYFQSNLEGEIINRIQNEDYDALVINPGAFTHYSYAIADALKNLRKPKVEVHISNIYRREEFRQKSVTAAYTDGILSGFGIKGYQLAVAAVLDLM